MGLGGQSDSKDQKGDLQADDRNPGDLSLFLRRDLCHVSGSECVYRNNLKLHVKHNLLALIPVSVSSISNRFPNFPFPSPPPPPHLPPCSVVVYDFKRSPYSPHDN